MKNVKTMQWNVKTQTQSLSSPSRAHIGQLQNISKSTSKGTMVGEEYDWLMSLHITMQLWWSLICLVKRKCVLIQIEGCLIFLILSTNLSYTQSVSWFTTARKEHIWHRSQHCCDLYKNTFPQRITSGFLSDVCRVVNKVGTILFSVKNMVQNNSLTIHN